MDLSGAAIIVGALLGAGGLTALLQARATNARTRAQAHQSDADADVTLGGGWHLMWESLRADNNELRERMAVVETREAECQSRLAQLESGHSSPAAVERMVVAMIDEEIRRRERST